MIYEMRTYNMKPGGAVAEFEASFAESLPHREKYSKLAAFFHTDFGPLNQVIHIWPYESLSERERIVAEAGKDPNWPPKNLDGIVDMTADILIPAPFTRPLGEQALGRFYEMRTYTFRAGTMQEVLKRWEAAMPYREEYSPCAGCFYSDVGSLNKWVHLWPYNSLDDRLRIRAESTKDPNWPPATREFQIKAENKLLIPASFSPMH